MNLVQTARADGCQVDLGKPRTPKKDRLASRNPDRRKWEQTPNPELKRSLLELHTCSIAGLTKTKRRGEVHNFGSQPGSNPTLPHLPGLILLR